MSDSNDNRNSSSTSWFVVIILALALLAIGYLVFSANRPKPVQTSMVPFAPIVEFQHEPATA